MSGIVLGIRSPMFLASSDLLLVRLSSVVLFSILGMCFPICVSILSLFLFSFCGLLGVSVSLVCLYFFFSLFLFVVGTMRGSSILLLLVVVGIAGILLSELFGIYDSLFLSLCIMNISSYCFILIIIWCSLMSWITFIPVSGLHL